MNRLTEADSLETFPEFCPARICLYIGSRKKERGKKIKGKSNMVKDQDPGQSKREAIPTSGSERK